MSRTERDCENNFRDAKQYFYAISRNVESYSEIARSIGESVFYTDSDLYNAAVRMAKDHFGRYDLRTLPVEAKMEIAKRLHAHVLTSVAPLRRALEKGSPLKYNLSKLMGSHHNQ